MLAAGLPASGHGSPNGPVAPLGKVWSLCNSDCRAVETPRRRKVCRTRRGCPLIREAGLDRAAHHDKEGCRGWAFFTGQPIGLPYSGLAGGSIKVVAKTDTATMLVLSRAVTRIVSTSLASGTLRHRVMCCDRCVDIYVCLLSAHTFSMRRLAQPTREIRGKIGK